MIFWNLVAVIVLVVAAVVLIWGKSEIVYISSDQSFDAYREHMRTCWECELPGLCDEGVRLRDEGLKTMRGLPRHLRN